MIHCIINETDNLSCIGKCIWILDVPIEDIERGSGSVMVAIKFEWTCIILFLKVHIGTIIARLWNNDYMNN